MALKKAMMEIKLILMTSSYDFILFLYSQMQRIWPIES
jgi:hypothetical protein